MLDYPKEIDIAIIAVKAEIVVNILKEVGFKKIPLVIIISSGFGEIGNEGKNKEDEIKKIAQEFGIHILGPNCLGIVTRNINFSFGSSLHKSGDISIISQSGAIGASLIDWINKENFGLHSFVSLGNKIDLSENDFLRYFTRIKEVKSIFLYLESFKNGREFFESTREISRVKPIVILKPGATKNAMHAMTSHTGALISDALAYKTAFSQANVINAETLEDFFTLMKYFSIFNVGSRHDPVSTNHIAIITNAGGLGVLLADLLPNSIPLDLGGGAKAVDYETSLKNLPRSLDALFCVMTPQEVTEIEKTATIIAKFQKSVKFPIFTILPGGNKIFPAHEILNRNNSLVFDFPEDAVRIYKKINNFFINKIQNSKLKTQNKFQIRKLISRRETGFKYKKINEQLPVEDVQRLAREYGMPVNEEYAVNIYEQCRQIAKKIGFPVVLKIHGEKFLHKTELNAVRLDLRNENEMHQGYQELLTIAEAQKDTITISKQIPKSFEVIIGVKRDPDFGHLLMFGMGGIYTEIMKDLSYGLLPLTKPQIINLIKKTKAYQIINGARNLPRLDLKGIIDCIEKLNRLILENPWISELDINPLLVSERNVKIVDLKIK